MFARTAERAVKNLDPVLSRYVRGTILYAGDVPGLELVADGVDPRALVLLDGLSPPDAPPTGCARVFVYQRNIERLAGNNERLDQEIVAALEREITATFLEGEPGTKDKMELN
jgi:hypothetical protein